ncbi:hypothetical protein BOX15_Mlig011931g1, partial [Macrostomum lignano]
WSQSPRSSGPLSQLLRELSTDESDNNNYNIDQSCSDLISVYKAATTASELSSDADLFAVSRSQNFLAGPAVFHRLKQSANGSATGLQRHLLSLGQLNPLMDCGHYCTLVLPCRTPAAAAAHALARLTSISPEQTLDEGAIKCGQAAKAKEDDNKETSESSNNSSETLNFQTPPEGLSNPLDTPPEAKRRCTADEVREANESESACPSSTSVSAARLELRRLATQSLSRLASTPEADIELAELAVTECDMDADIDYVARYS